MTDERVPLLLHPSTTAEWRWDIATTLLALSSSLTPLWIQPTIGLKMLAPSFCHLIGSFCVNAGSQRRTTRLVSLSLHSSGRSCHGTKQRGRLASAETRLGRGSSGLELTRPRQLKQMQHDQSNSR